jgi:beta-lactamase superfamily II metal-dependent hydrolase
MLFSLDVIPARKGDCLMLHYGQTNTDPHLILIDGGPRNVYGPNLRPRLEQIRAARGLAKIKPLIADLLMVSHLDDDHIAGILDLTKELITAEMSQQPPLIQFLECWHNSFDNIIDSNPDELTANFKHHFGAAAASGDPPEDLDLNIDHATAVDEEGEIVHSTLKVLASIEQGARLRNDVDRLHIDLNPEFGGKLIMAQKQKKAQTIDLGEDVKCTIIGPMLPDLKKLQEKHQKWLKDLKAQGRTPEQALAAYVDRSVPNLSSIVVLTEAGGKRMLLTGDARGNKILEGMELVGLMKKSAKIHVDVLKVPHHGSSNNLDVDFFERITADHYVISGNGEHGNPDREALQMLLNARGDDPYEIHLTYPVKDIDDKRKDDWNKEQTKQKARKKNPKVEVRSNWSPPEHSLTELFKKNKAFAKKVRVVSAGKPHVIDLLDTVTF